MAVFPEFLDSFLTEPLAEELGVGVVDWAAVEGCRWSFGGRVDQSGLELCHPLARKDWIKNTQFSERFSV